MSSEKITLFSTPAISLLRAINAPVDSTGAAHSIPILLSCIQAAAELWSTEVLREWVFVTRQMQLAVKSLPAGSHSLRIFHTPSSPSQQFVQFLNFKEPALKVGAGYESHALLGRSVIQCASNNQSVPADLLSGLTSIRLAQTGKGRRSKDWDKLSTCSFFQSEGLANILETLSSNSPIRAFVTSTIAVLNSLTLPPTLITLERNVHAISTERAIDHLKNPPGNVEAGEEYEIDEMGENPPAKEFIPDISTRLAAADYSSFGEKLGIPHRDQMMVGDLAAVTRQFLNFLNTGSPREQGFALLATLSVISGCSDTVALQLEFSPGRNIWLDLPKGAWAWDFRVYRTSKGGPVSSEFEPIYCPWPAFLDRKLAAALAKTPGASNLKDLVLSIQGADQFDLKGYRKFLRVLGHPSHPPYRGRIARSLTNVYLELTGSDMTAALMTGFFAATAPAALFYFGPRHEALRSRVSQVYERLGLGPLSPLFQEGGRAGCRKVLEVATLHKGWQALTEEINTVRKKALDTHSAEEAVSHCARWSALLCAAFVVQTAHRGSRLDCLTAAALYLHADTLVINDKDEGDRSQPRLIPKTGVVQNVLSGAWECLERIESIVNGDDKNSALQLDLTAKVFAQWSLHDGTAIEGLLETSVLASIINEFFSSESNFARSQWITCLDDDDCDRWLIRALTGHTRDVTRTHGPYIDVPPLVVSERLCVSMERTGKRIFGDAPLEVGNSKPFKLKTAPIKCALSGQPAYGPVPDPRTLLAPLSVEIMLGWRVVHNIRNDLIAGNIKGTPPVIAVLHLLFVDHIPDGELCLSAILEQGNVLRQIGKRFGLKWHRRHFVHPTWMPVQTATGKLLLKAGSPPPSRNGLIKEVCDSIRNAGYGSWPTAHNDCWDALSSVGASFRRLSFPPSLNAVSHTAVAAPCLSDSSLKRLAGEDYSVEYQAPPRKWTPGSTRLKGEDQRHLIRILNTYSSKIARHGERRQRAIDCLRELDDQTISWTPFISWLKDWVKDELLRSRDGLYGCYQISSISTYLSTLLTAISSTDVADDPGDWDDGEWKFWVQQIGLASAPTDFDSDGYRKETLNERAKPAILALANSLMRRKEYFPYSIRIQLGFPSTVITPHGSASSCLISRSDTAQSIELLKHWYEDSPGEWHLAKFRATLSEMVPVRSGDISSLTTRCLTPAGGLVIERTGYNVHKTPSAIRLVPLSAHDAAALAEQIDVLRQHFGERPLLLRGDGSTLNGLRDQRIADEWTLALKLATGDDKARPHSVRAATLQEIAWPGWQSLSAHLLNGTAGPSQCSDWVKRIGDDWIGLSRAVAMGGQADLRSALGNYLACWPMIYAFHSAASLAKLDPKPAFLQQLDILPATLRQARSRHKQRTQREGEPCDSFDVWSWLDSQTIASTAEQTPTKPIAASQQKPGPFPKNPVSTVNDESQILFISARCLGLSLEEAIERLQIPLRVARTLEPLLPSEQMISVAIRRGRKGPEQRGRAANLDVALSSLGAEVLSWLLTLSPEVLARIRHAFFRDFDHPMPEVDRVKFWGLASGSLPPAFCLCVRIGSKHLTTSEISALQALAPALQLKVDPRIGERPVLTISMRGKSNLVLNARITAVARCFCMAISSFKKAKVSRAVDAS